MFLKKNKITEILLLILSIVFFNLFDTSSLLLGQIIFCVSIVSNIQLLFKYRNISIFVVFLLFTLIHIVYIAVYYFFDIPYHYITKLQTLYNTNTVFLIQFIILRLFFVGINPNTFISPYIRVSKKNNSFVFWGIIFVLIILIPISNSGLSAVSSNYSIETKSSIWFEYSVIFVIVASLYANNSLKKNSLIFMAVIYMLMPLLYGKRLAFLMMFLTIFNLFYSSKIKTKYIFIFFILGFTFLRVFAQIRTTGLQNLDVFSLILSINEDSEVLSNGPGGVLVASVTYFDLVQQGIFDAWFSVKSFIGMFTAIVLPSSLNIPETYINSEALKYENIPGNGGFPGVYFYIWGRFVGVFIGGLLINYFLKKSQNSFYFAVYGVFLLSTFPRWYTYNMHVLIKMGAWLMIFTLISKLLKKYKHFK